MEKGESSIEDFLCLMFEGFDLAAGRGRGRILFLELFRVALTIGGLY